MTNSAAPGADSWIEAVSWNDQGLVPAIVQERDSRRLLMLAWMNRDALRLTFEEQRAVFWSRSRNRLWRKGETSGHVQKLVSVRLDCDGDAILIEVEQVGGIACHTGHERCFFRRMHDGAWLEDEAVIEDPARTQE